MWTGNRVIGFNEPGKGLWSRLEERKFASALHVQDFPADSFSSFCGLEDKPDPSIHLTNGQSTRSHHHFELRPSRQLTLSLSPPPAMSSSSQFPLSRRRIPSVHRYRPHTPDSHTFLPTHRNPQDTEYVHTEIHLFLARFLQSQIKR